MKKVNHYKWLDKHLPEFFEKIDVNFDHHAGIVGAHGDKGYCYSWDWDKHDIPFPHGMAIYLLTYTLPYSLEVRESENGDWVDPCQWVIDNYDRFRHHLPEIDETDPDVLAPF